MIVAISQSDMPAHTYPDPTQAFTEQDTVYAIGSLTQLDDLAGLVKSRT